MDKKYSDMGIVKRDILAGNETPSIDLMIAARTAHCHIPVPDIYGRTKLSPTTPALCVRTPAGKARKSRPGLDSRLFNGMG